MKKKNSSDDEFEEDFLEDDEEVELPEEDESEGTESYEVEPNFSEEDLTAEFAASGQPLEEDFDQNEVELAEGMEDEFDEEFEDEVPESKLLQFLSSQLPSLYKLVVKLQKKKSASDKPEAPKAEKAPLPKNIAHSDNEDLEEEDREKSKVELFIEEKLPSLAPLVAKLSAKKKTKSAGESEEGEEGEEGEKPKRKLKVIHIVLLVGFAFAVLYESDTPEEAPAPPVAQTPPAEAPPPAPTEPAPQPPPAGEQAEPEEIAPIENAPVFADDPFDSITPTEVEEEAAQNIKETEFAEQDFFSDVDSEPEIQDASSTVEDQLDEIFSEPELTDSGGLLDEPEDAPIEPEQTVQVEPEPEPAVNARPTANFDDELALEDKILDEVAYAEGGEEITEAILRQLEKDARERRDKTVANQGVGPAQAPSYFNPGAGLVYNCSGRHWACVSDSAFAQCSQNYAWNVSEENPIECYPSEAYESELDCAGMQQYKIDMAAPTDFCR